MEDVYVITSKENIENDSFVLGVNRRFNKDFWRGWHAVHLLDSVEGKRAWKLQYLFHGESPTDRRVIEYIEEKDKKPIERSRVVVTKENPINRRDKNKRRQILANLPLDLRVIQEAYPLAQIAGYAHDLQEERNVQEGFGINNVFVFLSARERDSKIGLSNIVGNVIGRWEDSHISDILTTANLDGILAEGMRRHLEISYHYTLGYIFEDVKTYSRIQDYFYEKHGTNDVESLWEYSPLRRQVGNDVSLLPILAGVRYVDAPEIGICVGNCVGDISHNIDLYWGFLKKYETLLKKCFPKPDPVSFYKNTRTTGVFEIN